MQEVNIYTYQTIRSLKERKGALGYVLECATAKGPVTLTNVEKITATTNKAELVVLASALGRLKKPCKLCIYTDSGYLIAGFESGWIERWKKDGWITARGTEVAHKIEWEALEEQLKQHEVSFEQKKPHEYREWLVNETRRKEQG